MYSSKKLFFLQSEGHKYKKLEGDGKYPLSTRLAVETVGTYLLASTVALSSLSGNLGPLAIGFILSISIFAFGHISGGHFNPAVTLAVCIRRKVGKKDAALYMLVQLLGALIGAIQQSFVLDDLELSIAYPARQAGWISAIVTEITFTFALAIVVLNVATTKAQENNHYFGLAIGLTVAAAAAVGGPVSGGAFNPAIGVVLPIVSGNPEGIWVYMIGPFLGALLAAGFFRLTAAPEEFESSEE